MRSAPWLLVLAAGCTCGPVEPPPDPDSGTACTDCNLACPAGFRALDGGAGCVAVLALECDAGTMPTLGSTGCTPVGVRSCPAGFVTDGSGWGCRDVISPTPCTGATREKLGSTTCVPVGDCGAAFPPAAATLFVSAAYTAGQLDSTHFDTLQAAVAAADAGTTIAIDEGTYVGTVTPTRPVSLIGRCAERVTLVPTDGGINVGLRLVDLSGTVVKNLTVRGFPGGVAVFGGSAELSGLVVEGNTIGGVIVSNGGTQVTLRDSVIRGQRARPTDRQTVGAWVQKQGQLVAEEVAFSDNEFASVVATNPDAGATLRRVVVRDGFPLAQGPAVGTFGVGTYAVDGAWVLLEESAVLGNTTEGVLVARGGTRPGFATVRNSTVRGTRANAAVDGAARGIEVGKGGTLDVEGCTVTGNAEHEILVTEGGNARITNTTTVGAADTSSPSGTGLLVGYDAGAVVSSFAAFRPRAVGIETENGGVLELNDSLITDVVLAAVAGSTNPTSAFGISQKPGTEVTMNRSLIRGAAGVALLLSTAKATLTDSVILDTLSNAGEAGRAVSVQDQSVFTATRSAFIGSHETGVVTFDFGTTATLVDSSIERTSADLIGNFGLGALAATGSFIDLTRCTVNGNQSIGIAASAAGIAVRGSFISWNAVGVHAQDGAALGSSDPVVLTANVLGVSSDTRFVGNGVRTGLGSVPLPSK